MPTMQRVLIVFGLLVLGCDREAPTTTVPDEPSPGTARSELDLPPPDADASPGGRRLGPRPARTIYRSEVDRALAGGPGYLLRELGPQPFRHSGRFVGWEITQLFPDDPELCEPCDLALGDIILSVNGDRLETPQSYSNMVGRLSTMKSLTVKMLRRGKRREATYTIAEDRSAGAHPIDRQH